MSRADGASAASMPKASMPKASMPKVVHVVLPRGVADPATPSGGNAYDRRICAGLAATGRHVHTLAVAGDWPRPGDAALDALDTVLGDVPPGATVLVDGIVGCAAPDVVVRQAARLRIVVVVHLPLADETGLEPSVAAALDASERRTLHAAAAVVATSSATAARLVRRHGLESSRLVVAPPGVDSAPVASRSTAGGRLVCVASVIPRKGHDVLVEALSRVADLGWTLACVGPLDRDARHAGLVRRQIHAHGLQDRVHLRGPLAGDDLAALYADADLLVLASRAEPYGMVVTEALARAVPVLATAVDGLPEALGTTPDGGPPGMLVPAGDPAALAAALRRWLTEPPLRQRLRSAALARRPRLRSWEETTATLAGALGRPGRVA